jgi:nitrogen regulatory protein PII
MAAFETTKITLLTIIASFELKERIVAELKELGVKHFTASTADGHGIHGVRARGFVEQPNLRIEVLLPPATVTRVLQRLFEDYTSSGLGEGAEAGFTASGMIAFMHDVEAAPRAHFAPTDSLRLG